MRSIQLSRPLRIRMIASTCASSLLVVVLAGGCAHRTGDAAREARLTSANVEDDTSALSALGHGADPRPIPDGVVTPMGGPVDGESEAIAQALCARKLACDEIGPNRSYTDDESCLAPARRAAQMHLGTVSACPAGLRQGALEACVRAVAAEGCSSALDVTKDVAACRSERLCK